MKIDRTRQDRIPAVYVAVICQKWETFWTGGITNPLDVVEQMTYLMFIHDLDAADNQRAKESAMLGLPHRSIFAGKVQVGERTIPGHQLK